MGVQGWHPGELAIQRKLNFDGPMSMVWRSIDPLLPEQHREFHTTRLPFVPLTSLDTEGRPWVSILAGGDGRPGFIQSPAENMMTMRIRTWEGDPFEANAMSWVDDPQDSFLVAGIGIEFSTRRRNKFAGSFISLEHSGEHDHFVALEVNEALGNCPKYINVRDLVPQPVTHPVVEYRQLHMGEQERLPADIAAFITEADTIFIGTSYAAKPEDAHKFPSHVGANQRGGRPGFVRLRPSDDKTLVLPDYSGNRFMTSLGNIESTPLAAITIVSFTTGSVLYLTGHAKTIVGSDAQKLMARQNVLTTISVTGYTFVTDALPVRQRPGSVPERSPYSPPIKLLNEEKSASSLDLDEVTVRLRSIELLSDSLATFQWDITSSQAIDIESGQAAILDFSSLVGTSAYQHMSPFAPSSVNDDRIRTWTVSSAHTQPGGTKTFALTMRQKPGGVVTGALFSIAKKLRDARPELLADARVLSLDVKLVGISGDFVMPPMETGRRMKMMWIAGGIGVTPFMSMLAALRDTRSDFDAILALSTREPDVLVPLVLRHMENEDVPNQRLRVDVFTETPSKADWTLPTGVDIVMHHGRPSLPYWEGIGDLTSRKPYLCGPKSFEEASIDALRSCGVNPADVVREGFEY